MKKRFDKPEKYTGSSLLRMCWYGDDESFRNVAFEIATSDKFSLERFFVREDAEWDYFGGLQYQSKEDLLKHKKDVMEFDSVREIDIYGKIGDARVSFVVDFYPRATDYGVLASYEDGCPIDEFMESLGL